MELNDILDEEFTKPQKNTSGMKLSGVFLLFQIIGLTGGNMLAFRRMEYILFSGIFVVILSVVLLLFSVFSAKSKLILLVSVYTIVVATVMFLLIYIYEMGPSEAKQKLLLPLTVINIPFCIVWIIFTVKFWKEKIQNKK